jgi:hypothetical protein
MVMQREATLTASADSPDDTISTLLMRFHERIRQATFAGRLTAATPSHPIDKARSHVFTFNADEYSRALQDSSRNFIIHHGSKILIPGMTMRELTTEYLMPFACVTRGEVHLSRAQLADILTGKVTTWDALGYGAGPIRLLGHGGRVHHRVFRACVARNFSIPSLPPIELFPSYSALGKAACSSDRYLVFGFRPAHMEGTGLMPVIIEDTKPWCAYERSRVPSLTVYISWRNYNERDETVRRDLSYYLDLVGARLEADARALSRAIFCASDAA